MVALAIDARKPASRSTRLSTLVLGADPVQRRAVKRLLVILQAYVVIWLLIGLAIGTGLTSPVGWWLVAYGVVGQGIFFALLRGGYTLKLADPLFCFPQVLFGVGAVVIGYALIPFGQGPALQVLFVLLVYDLHRLSEKQIGFIAASAVVLLSATVALTWMRRPDGVDLQQEALNIGLAVLVIPMLSAVGRAVRRVHVKQIEKRAELDKVLGELKTLSQRDALTGAVNRRYMLELLGDELKRHRRAGRPFSVAMLDIDWFKRINDTYGHAVGDKVLQRMAALAQGPLRGTDVVARWGGEEFLLLFPVCDAAEAALMLERLREDVARFEWHAVAPGLSVSFSAGVVAHVSEDTVEQTVDKADAAMYRAKEQGRNRVEQG